MQSFNHLLILSIFLISSCGQNEKGNTETNIKLSKERQDSIKHKNYLKTLNIISSQFGASASIDTVHYTETYRYQNLLSKNNRVIVSGYEVTDIKQVDSVFKISLYEKYKTIQQIDFTCTKDQFKKLFPDYLDNKMSLKLLETNYLILKINSISKIKFKYSIFLQIQYLFIL